MCTVCGCSDGNVKIESAHSEHAHEPIHEDHLHASELRTGYGKHNASLAEHGADLHFGKGPAHAHVAGMSQSRMVKIEQDILGKNDHYAEINRAHFMDQQIFALNLVSSPGSGKTTLLIETIKRIKAELSVAVIEGDQQTANDADRIRETGIPAIQVNTGKGCHLDAHMVGHALDHLKAFESGLLFIENVGNLVCPAAFDLGEAHKVAILSVTEGEDKPLKYPDMFYAADVMILNKTDLLPYLDFDVEKCIGFAKQVNPDIKVLKLSAKSGEGMSEWLAWLNDGRASLVNTGIEGL